MRIVRLGSETDFDGWRDAARDLALQGVAPEAVVFRIGEEEGDLLALTDPGTPGAGIVGKLSVPRDFLPLAQTVIQHSDPQRFALLYKLLWRLQREKTLLGIRVDPDVARAEALAKSVRRDIHKMHAFVRFREISTEAGPRFVAWFEPEHHIVEVGAGFFVRRFSSMRWSILTPRLCAHWDLETLSFSPGASRRDAPSEDAMEEAWKTYYSSIFNPARLKVDAMRAEMPKKYWRNLPEAPLIGSLIRAAGQRTDAMVAADLPLPKINPQRSIAQVAAMPAVPGSLAELRNEAAGCRACPLWEPATQTVFGDGPVDARVMFLGEQPGDREDLAGKPFVGPAGQLFDKAMGEAGLDRSAAYVTNAVKHFKFVAKGKARIHAKPGGGEIQVCRQWFERERALVQPDLIVAMGATAVQSLFGKAMPVGANRGRVMPASGGGAVLITVHPSYLLRLPDPAQKEAEYARFVADLRLAAPFMGVGRRAA